MACISMPTAMLISGGLGAAGSLATGFMGANAATSAANVQAQTAKAQQQQTAEMFKTVQSNMQPFVAGGQAAIPGIENLLGLGPNGNAGILAQLQSTPGYQFALNQGLQATQSGFAAQGLGQSGAALKGAANYAEGLAGTTYGNVFSNFLQTAGLGAQASGQLANSAATFQGAQNALAGTGAAATAGGIVGSTNSLTSGITNALGGVSNAAMLLGMNSSGMFGGNTNAGNPLFPQGGWSG